MKKAPDPDPLVRGTDPGIRIRTNMSRIPNSDANNMQGQWATQGLQTVKEEKQVHYTLIIMRTSLKIMKITFQGVLNQIYYLYTTRKHLYIYHN